MLMLAIATLADAAADIGGGVAGGGLAGLGAAGAVGWYLISQHRIERKEWAAQLAAVEDRHIKALEGMVNEYKALAREIQTENRQRNEQWLTVNKEMVAALEHVSEAMGDQREALTEVTTSVETIGRAVGDLTRRVDAIPGSKEHRALGAQQ